jgi:thioredoxin reductase
VVLADGRSLAFAGLFVMPRSRIAGPLAAELGCELEDGPFGAFVKTDLMRETSVRGVFACGDMAMAAGSIAIVVGDGTRAGISAHQSLVFR